MGYGPPYPHGETVTILHPGVASAPDEYGETTAAPTSEVVAGCAVAPGDSRENTLQQPTVKVDWTVFMPSGVTVEPAAQVVVRDVTYEVEGEPEDWRNPFTGARPGIVVALTRSQ